MSDSDSKDSDEGIRYKTESVRKACMSEHSRKSGKDQTRERSKRRYTQSSSTKREKGGFSSKTKKREKRKRYSSSSSTSSYDEQSKSKYSNHDKKYSQNKLKTKIKSTNFKERDQSNNGKVLGPSLPPHSVRSSGRVSNMIEDNGLKPQLPSTSIGPELPPHMIKKTFDLIVSPNEAHNLGIDDEQIDKNEAVLEPREVCFGPQLPPALVNHSPLAKILRNEDQNDSVNMRKPLLGPKLPPHINSGSEIIIGPSLLELKNECPNEHNKVVSKLQMDAEKPRYMKSYSENLIGPSLPNFKKEDTNNDNKDTPKSLIGPEIPPCMNSFSETIVGPSFQNLEEEDPKKDNKEISETSIGPALPPYMINTNKTDTIKTFGPTLPPDLRKKLQEEIEEPCKESNIQGDDDEEEEDTYGPLPVGMLNNSYTQKALEERALQLKIDQLQPKSSTEPVRETWMIELPAVKASNLGLGPRQFRNRSGPDMSDRSSWTDLPGDKHKKKIEEVVDLKADAEMREIRKRDEEQEKLTKKIKRKEKSLLKMHADKLKSEKKDEGPSERRPFSRDVDLQVNRFDDAQKKAILKKAQLLDTRFSSGKSKYL